MVERPIKKSERQAKADTEGNSEQKSFTPPVKVNPADKDNRKGKDDRRDNDNRRDKGKGRGRKSSGRDEIKPPVNPALARPPRPSKPPVKVEATSDEATEVAAQDSQDSNEVGSYVAVSEESQNTNDEQNNS